jgi:hypothetical protein
MKIKDELSYDHQSGKIIHKKTHDYTPELNRAKVLREAIGEEQKGADKKLVGTIPLALIGEWIKEAGIEWSDTDAVQEVMKRKILSGEFDQFRVWKGKY